MSTIAVKDWLLYRNISRKHKDLEVNQALKLEIEELKKKNEELQGNINALAAEVSFMSNQSMGFESRLIEKTEQLKRIREFVGTI